MFKVIVVMVLGVLFGRLLRGRKVKVLHPAISVLIWALLFLLGIQVGHNRQIISSLGTLGVEAVIIAALSMVGSLVLAWLLWTVVRPNTHRKP